MDCNGDGALDMLRLEGKYTATHTVQVCLHDGQGFECGTDLECLGANLSALQNIVSADVENTTNGLKLLTSLEDIKKRSSVD